MAIWDKFFKKDKPAGAAVATPPATSPSAPIDPEAAVQNESAKPASTIIGPDGQPQKKSIFKKFESGIRRKVDGYVDAKADQLLDDATKRAEEFRQETLDAVRSNAMELLDLTEQRIDEKLVEIEQALERRLQAELKMRLRALVWTLAFVLLMAAVSFAYVWVKQSAGVSKNSESTKSE